MEISPQPDFTRLWCGALSRLPDRATTSQASARHNGLYRALPDVCDELLPFFSGELLTADLFPDCVRGFGEEQIRGDVLVWTTMHLRRMNATIACSPIKMLWRRPQG
jgi:hypothetical protein